MLNELLSWWLRQIKTFVPAAWLAIWEDTACVLNIQLRPSQRVQFSARHNQTILPGGDFTLVPVSLSHKEAVQHFIQTLPLSPSHVLLQLDPLSFMAIDVALPLAAEQNLTQALGFQINQLTPFEADDVIFFCGVQQRFPDQKKLQAWLVVVPNSSIQPILVLLQPISAVLIQGPNTLPEPDQPLQLSYRLGNKRPWFSFRNNITLLFIGLFVLGCSLSLHLYNRFQSHAYVQQHVVTMRQQASQADRLKKQLTRLQLQATEFSQRKSSAVPVLALWNDVTQRLSDDTWLYQFEVQGRELAIRGVSDDTSVLIQWLDASPYLYNVSFMASVTRDQQTNKARFYIGADIIVQGAL